MASNSATNKNTTNAINDPPLSPSSMAIAKRIHPGALTIDKGNSHKNTARPIPAFLTKLFTMVNDPSTDHLIKWNEPNGDSFFVVSSERFGRELLPKYFKHSNFGSFVRQLNMYGFHKVPHLNQGVLQGDIPETEMLEFTNLNFQRGQPDLLCLIQRKKPCPELTHPTTTDSVEPLSATLQANSSNSHNDLQVILADIASIRKHQNSISSDLKTLQSSNAHLWKEAIANRDRNKRCQDTINKILGFLAQVFAGKLSSLQDPPTGASIPELDRHRSKNSRDHQHSHSNDLGYPSSPSNSALSLYSKIRHPRLMLEDTQRPPPLPKPADPSHALLAHTVSNSDSTLGNGISIRNNMSLNNDKNNKNTNGAPSPSLSARNSSSTGSSPDLISSPPFCDSSIDPNLETASLDGTNKTTNNQTTANNFGAIGATEQSNPDAVLQALFNDNFSSGGGYNFNDNLFSGINWSEVFSTSNELNSGFNENKSQQPSTFMTPLSPLRITDGDNAAPLLSSSSSALSPINISNDPSNRLVTDAQAQANGIGNVANKVESLEAAIERLVGSLPDSIEDPLPLEFDSNPMTKSRHENVNLFQPSTAPSRPDYCGSDNTTADFDTDALFRTLVSSDNEDRIKSAGAVQTSGLSAGSEEISLISASPSLESRDIQRRNCTNDRSTTMTMTRMKEQLADQASKGRPTAITDHQSMDTLDLDRILNEWTCEDVSRMSPVAGINPGRLSSSLSMSSLENGELSGLHNSNPQQRNYDLGEENVSTSHQFLALKNPDSSVSSSQKLHNSHGFGSKNPSSSRLLLDLNDDDQLRRIMSKKSATTIGEEGGNDDLNTLNPTGCLGTFTANEAGSNGSLTVANNVTFPKTSRLIENSSSAVLGNLSPNKSPTDTMLISSKSNNGVGNYSDTMMNLLGSSTAHINNINDPNNHNLITNNDNHQTCPIRKRFLEDTNHQSFHHLIPSHHFDNLNDSSSDPLNDQSKSISLQQKKSRIY